MYCLMLVEFVLSQSMDSYVGALDIASNSSSIVILAFNLAMCSG